jgi:hypothetical protein
MFNAESQRVTHRECMIGELRLVKSIAFHSALGAKPPAATQLEQPIVAIRFEAALLEQHADESHLIGRKPEPCGDFAIAQARRGALTLDFGKIQKAHRVATAILNIEAEVKDDRPVSLDHCRRDAEAFTSRQLGHVALSRIEQLVARRHV